MLIPVCTYVGLKKPAGTAEEIEKHFGCESSRLIMVDKDFVVFIFHELVAYILIRVMLLHKHFVAGG